MAYKDRFNNNNKHHENNATEVITTSDATSEETLVIEANNNVEEVIDDATVLNVQPVEEEKEEPKMEEEVKVTDEKIIDNSKEIEELKDKIEAWEAELKRSRNNVISATLYDNIKEAKKKIRDLSSQLPPVKAVEVKDYVTVTDKAKSTRKLESVEDHIVRII